ncbi:MAG: hypothetical protein WC813_01175 [Patescibacteria group bacterium]|jgi:hypothetical protein
MKTKVSRQRNLVIIILSVILMTIAIAGSISRVFPSNNKHVSAPANPAYSRPAISPKTTTKTSPEPHPNDYYVNSLVKIASFGDSTWEGRVTDKQFILVKKDSLGRESVVYTQDDLTTYPFIDWSYTKSESAFILQLVEGYSEGADYTDIVYQNGKETIRSTYAEDWGAVEDLTLIKPGYPSYTIALQATPDACQYEEAITQDGKYDIQKTTTIEGVVVTSEGQSALFQLPKPQTAPCAVIDGGTAPPWPTDLQTSAPGISFSLPGGGRALVSIPPTTSAVQVKFY